MGNSKETRAGLGLCAIALLLLALFLNGCKLGSQAPASKGTSTKATTSTSTNTAVSALKTILVSWTANREAAVNSAGGGYKVYYSKTNAAVPVGSSSVVNVPYVSGALAPTTAQLPNLSAGTYFVKVVAYSTRNATGAVSAISSLVVP